MPPLPKLSYVLLSHNREKYVRTAVESALAQDYKGELEYIFSDDCSTDRTFEIIKECVAAYKGNRRVVVTQPPTNLKTAGNFNHAVSLAQGDWIIRADDDDISAVDRCTATAKAIMAVPGCSFIGISSQHSFTDATEESIIKLAKERHEGDIEPTVTDIRRDSVDKVRFNFGKYCYLTWNKEVFKAFGDLPREAFLADDYILFFRASLMGKGILLSEPPLYFIRKNSLNQSVGKEDGANTFTAVMRRERFFDEYQNSTAAPMRETYEALLDFARQMPQEEQPGVLAFLADMQERICTTETLRSYWRKGTINRIRIARELGMTKPYDMLRCLPMPVFAALLAAIRKFKHQH